MTKQWYSTKNLADFLKITRTKACYLLNKYQAELTSELKETYGRGGKSGRSFLISADGMRKLLLIKDSGRNGGLRTLKVSNLKSKAADRIIQPVSNELMSDPIIAVRVKQLEMEKRVNSVEQKVETLLTEKAQAKEQLDLLPAPNVEAPTMSDRAKLIRLIALAQRKSGLTHPEVWAKLYTEIYYRMGVNVSKRAKTAGVAKIDILERDGLLDPAYAIAKETFKT